MSFMRALRIAASGCACCLALIACGDEGGNDGKDPHAEIELWPIPTAGSVVPIMNPRAADVPSGGAGQFSGSPRDAAVPSDPVAEEDAGPPDPDRSFFDPEQVYLFGTLSEGACYRDAVAPVEAPSDAVVGFACDANESTGWIRPTDGRLLYTDGQLQDTVVVFTCDGCTKVTAGDPYPTDPLANDDRIELPCPGAALRIGYQLAPNGRVYHLCNDGWYDQDGDRIPTREAYLIVHLGPDDTALLSNNVLDLTSGEMAPLSGLADLDPLAARALEDGYWIAIQSSATEPTELWHVALDGTATQLGTYPPLPANQSGPYGAKLDGQGRLFQMARDTTESSRDTIVRRSIDGQSQVVYDEADDPLVKIHISSLFTGP